MTRLPLRAPDKTALRDFIDAVLALSDDPASPYVGRYLAASQALEDSRPRRGRKARAKSAFNQGERTA